LAKSNPGALLNKADQVLDNPGVQPGHPQFANARCRQRSLPLAISNLPKLTRTADSSGGTGFYINPTPPEEAAKFLRAATVEEPATTSVG
jgi:UDPglucose--hexose-1-phosphate uridylyltransferase